MRLVLDSKKTIDQNASVYFEKAKKAKHKLEGAMEALIKSQKKLVKLEKDSEAAEKKAVDEVKKKEEKKKQEWYEKFRWFISSEGVLCIGGKDATSNEIVIKKHTEKDDTVFHTDMAGSPFFVVKGKAGKITFDEVAEATASYSRAWRHGLATLDVFKAKPEQITKTAKSGEFVPKGAFMVYGKIEYFHPDIKLAVGNMKGKIVGGPVNAIKKSCEKYVEVSQGREKAGAIAKKIQKKIGGELDDIIRVLPAGGCELR
ncbi:DUF814 domain-containing protein [Candidatus Woesearchaeota archaeon]|nr:DUF814 domain-containing protein [Candidatus Woesearchaeota archaeon]